MWIANATLNFQDNTGVNKQVAATNAINAFTQRQTIDVNIANTALRVTQRGTGEALRVEDDTTPDATAFVISNSGRVGVGVTPDATVSLSVDTTGVKFGDGTIQTTAASTAGGTKTYSIFTVRDNQPPATAFATLDTRNSIAVLDFDDATDESAIFLGVIPEAAVLGSGLKIRIIWTATSAISGDCIWDVSLERMTTDINTDSFDTSASVTTTTSGTSGVPNYSEITLTTIDSVTAGDGFRLKINRDANNGSDTMTGDAELIAVEVRSAS
jgi:hypothetical protein